MNKRKLIVAIITAVLIFSVGTLLAIAEFQELTLLKKFKDSIPHAIFVNIFAKFDGIWTLFVGIAIIITFDCIFLFIKEEYDSLIAKKKAKNTSCLKEDVV